MAGQPRFTIISAVYNVGRYLPEFIASIEAQDFDLSRVEVIMVDDGSSDDSHARLTAWAQRRPELVTVITQPNAGQGAARNTGMRSATGEWVTFPDPDDIVDPNYLSTVDAFATAHPDVHMVAANRLIWNETTGVTSNTHPLFRFFSHDRLVDLEDSETSFHGSAPAAFFRLDVLREFALAFDDRIRPNFEDGHFSSLYLLHCRQPKVGFLKSTSYHYRKRADQSSSLQGSMLHPGRYTDVFEHGYAAILDAAEELTGTIPRWLQHFLAYELLGYLSAYENGTVPVLGAGPEIEAFHAHMTAVLRRLDLEHVLPRLEMTTAPWQRDALQHGYSGQDWCSAHVLVDTFDKTQKLARVRYLYAGAPPTEIVVNGETEVSPRHAKTRDLNYFGRTLLRERIMWVRYTPDLRIKLNGDWAEVAFLRPISKLTRVSANRLRRHTGRPSRYDRRLVERVVPVPETPLAKKARALADKPRTAKKFADAWVLMDRVHDAGDSGEVLFRRLRTHHREINAWFVIEQGTADWTRLRKEFGKRVVAHGSLEWMALMAHCSNLLSSHADVPIMAPTAIATFAEANWRFTFLQHGVIKDDLSSWLNRKQIDLFVTSTRAELASIAGDGTPYVFTTKETKLTGLPRFDRLREVGQRFGPDQRDLLLVAPTWRQWLVESLAVDSQRRSSSDAVLDSDFVHQWLDLLRSPELAELCRAHGLTIGFLPHPNLQSLLPRLDLPAHVRPLSYDGVDVQEYFARARVLVTDYSSIAFNAAYLNRPTVYFQFDADLVTKGSHVGRPGYFSYTADGFGPVTEDTAGAVDAVRDALAHGADPQPEYLARIEATFPDRDGSCSERVIAEVLALRKTDRETQQVPTPAGRP
ncbi:glycosyltransferase involved in cell wall biosynthesis [Marmoricola sp. OAE513]|uniref:bifunctional glycosyltransferase/CDP-glycerol:glycerophosphate glycerophosphotransferase n=1 Tax=Marmoricola sp. OAE513 TaxID=2817894 RepID=UPI001AEA1E77